MEVVETEFENEKVVVTFSFDYKDVESEDFHSFGKRLLESVQYHIQKKEKYAHRNTNKTKQQRSI